MLTLFICFFNVLVVILLAGYIDLPEWFIISYGVIMCFLYFAGCISECNKKERIERLETEIRELKTKLIYAVAKHNRLEEEIKKNERYH
jgi:outer membrane murein-binding lipoprotein Lpp